MSDRRGTYKFIAAVVYNPNIWLGGRTAWSATVTVQGVNVAARYWYDGQYIENAKDDAAEVMLTKLRTPSITAASQAQHQTRAGYGSGGWAR